MPQISKIPEIISELWKTWINATLEKRATWDQCQKHYLQSYVDETDYKDYPWRCKVTRPVCQEVVDTVSAAIKNALFPSNDDYFEVKGDDVTGKQYEKLVQDYLRDRLFLSRFVSRMEPFIKQVCIVGNSAGDVSNRRERIDRKRWQDFNIIEGMPGFVNVPRFEHNDIFSVAFNPALSDYEQGTTRIKRTITTLSDLKAKSHLYSNLSKIKPSSYSIADVTDSARTTRRSRFGINEGLRLKKGEVELLTLFGDVEVGKKVYRDYLVVVANRETVIRFEPIPYFCGNTGIFAKYSSVPGEMLGRGVVEPIIGLQQLIDTFSCQKADLINLILGGFWAINPDALIEIDNTMMRPQGAFLLEDVNQIKSLAPTANPTLAFAEINDLRDETERSSGASKMAQGIMTGGRQTATEASIVGQGTNNRFTDITVMIGEQAAEPSLNMFLQIDFQYNAYRRNPLTGEPYLPDKAWDGRYYVEFNGARQSALRAVATQLLIQFMDIAGRNEIFAQKINPEGMLMEFAKLLNINSSKIISTDTIFQKESLGNVQTDQAASALAGQALPDQSEGQLSIQ